MPCEYSRLVYQQIASTVDLIADDPDKSWYSGVPIGLHAKIENVYGVLGVISN